MRSWVWTSPSSVKVFEAGWCVVARPALQYPLWCSPQDARASDWEVMPGLGALGGLEAPATGYNEKRCLVRPARA